MSNLSVRTELSETIQLNTTGNKDPKVFLSAGQLFLLRSFSFESARLIHSTTPSLRCQGHRLELMSAVQRKKTLASAGFSSGKRGKLCHVARALVVSGTGLG